MRLGLEVLRLADHRLRVWIMPTHMGSRTESFFSQLIGKYLADHPGIKIELRVIPWSDSCPLIVNSLMSDDPPDLFQSGATWVGTLAHLGYLSPVPTGLIKSPTIAPWLNEIASLNGVQYGVPWLTECSCLLARFDIIELYGIDPDSLSTWEGFYEACSLIGQHCNENGQSPPPFNFPCRPDYNTLHNATPWLRSGGWQIDIIDPSENQFLSHPSALAGWNYLSRLSKVNPLPTESYTLGQQEQEFGFFLEGQYAFYIGYWWRIVRRLTKHIPDFAFPIRPIPFPKGPGGMGSRGGGSALAVSSRSRQTELAWDLARYLTEDDFMREWVKVAGPVPAHDGIFWEQHKGDQDLEFLREQVQNAKPFPIHPLWHSVEKHLFKGVSNILWHFAQGNGFDEKAIRFAEETDEHIQKMLELSWDFEKK